MVVCTPLVISYICICYLTSSKLPLFVFAEVLQLLILEIEIYSDVVMYDVPVRSVLTGDLIGHSTQAGYSLTPSKLMHETNLRAFPSGLSPENPDWFFLHTFA
jgi:hypothetical protein